MSIIRATYSDIVIGPTIHVEIQVLLLKHCDNVSWLIYNEVLRKRVHTSMINKPSAGQLPINNLVNK